MWVFIPLCKVLPTSHRRSNGVFDLKDVSRPPTPTERAPVAFVGEEEDEEEIEDTMPGELLYLFVHFQQSSELFMNTDVGRPNVVLQN